MNKRIIIAFSIGLAVGALVAICLKKLRNQQTEPEDLAGETRPMVILK